MVPSSSLGKLSFLLAFALATLALGQAFNIDCATPPSTGPAATYGAGSGQQGYWNATFQDNLRDLSGNLTPVFFGGSPGTNTHVIPGATGADKTMMESTLDMSPSDVVIISNLMPGFYDVYLYSWGGQIFGPRTVGLSVFNGSNNYNGSVSFGSQWPGGQVEGTTFARIPIQVAAGKTSIGISIGSGHDYDVLAGIQLVRIPAPGVPLVMLGAGVLFAPRRRRG